MKNYVEKYKTYTNRQLAEMLQKPEDYLPEAIEAAREELKERNLSQEEMGSIQAEFVAIAEKIERKKEKQQDFRKYLEKNLKRLYAILDPIPKEDPSTERKINSIAFLLGCLSIYQIWGNWWMIPYIIEDGLSVKNLEMIPIILPILICPLATYFFWKKKRIGWILTNIFLALILMSLIPNIALFMRNSPSSVLFGNSVLDELFLRPPLFVFYLGAALFLAFIWLINRSDIRAVFKIDMAFSVLSILFTAVLYAIFFFPFT